jgi:polysaccharide export outer membrane protein
MTPPSLTRRGLALIATSALAACAAPGAIMPRADEPMGRTGRIASGAHGFANIGYASWSDDEPPYRLYPGDELEVTVPSAPELSKTVTVQPDGRVSLPLIHSVMVADRTTGEVEDALRDAYSSQLIRPDVEVAIKAATPLKVFVGGEVDKPGVYDMPGDINALQAVIQAGGFKASAKRDEVIVIRRGADGRAMMRTCNLARGLANPRVDLVPLRRFDIVYVPRTGLASAGIFVQQLKDLVPGNVGFDYAVTNSTKLF